MLKKLILTLASTALISNTMISEKKVNAEKVNYTHVTLETKDLFKAANQNILSNKLYIVNKNLYDNPYVVKVSIYDNNINNGSGIVIDPYTVITNKHVINKLPLKGKNGYVNVTSYSKSTQKINHIKK